MKKRIKSSIKKMFHKIVGWIKNIEVCIFFIICCLICIGIGRYYPSYSFLFRGHGGDIWIGVLSGLMVSFVTAVITRIPTEKQTLGIAKQGYARYCIKLRETLEECSKNGEYDEVLRCIRNEQYYFGFDYTNSVCLGELNNLTNEITTVIEANEMNKTKVHNYSYKLFKLQLEILKAPYRFYLFGKKKLYKTSIKVDNNGNTYVQNEYKR